jgi:hypothetical protein
MDNPALLVFSMLCLAPLSIFGLGVWVGRGLPGMPFRLHIERVERDRPTLARGRRGQEDAWQP